MSKGIFITFEGSEGCGKSTQIELLHQRMEEAEMHAFSTREPGGTAWGEEIRELLLFSQENEFMTPEAELLLFSASRAQLVREKIRPTLKSGTHVILDRFVDSTTVYQGYGRGLDIAAIKKINQLVIGDCIPDITFLLDMDSEKAHLRERPKTDRMERQPPQFYEKVRQGYLKLAEQEKERIVLLDASQSREKISDSIWQILLENFHGLFCSRNTSLS